ncbi:MAG: class II aldolase/adducin family protein [Gammaproteobacteria bacterium]|nr:class II aldolase/adducin family protein [Gammaproteobacteria bacterium]
MRYEAERSDVAAAARTMLETGLVVNTSGNVSVRIGEHVAITPSGCPYEDLAPSDIVVLDLDGKPVDGDLVPSSETPLHLSLYKGDESIGAIVHTHSVYATAVSTLVDTLPAIHYQIADLGGPVPVAPYRTFGTPELAAVVSDAMKGRHAALMQNHGAVTVGDTVDQALSRCITLEWLSRVYLIAQQNGTPSLIDDEELERVKAQQKKFRGEQKKRLRNRK